MNCDNKLVVVHFLCLFVLQRDWSNFHADDGYHVKYFSFNRNWGI